MKKCKRCTRLFDVSFDADSFESDTSFPYSCVTQCLCAKCAKEAWDDREEDVFEYNCDKCGEEFDVMVDDADFSNRNGQSLIGLWYKFGTLCADCMEEQISKGRR